MSEAADRRPTRPPPRASRRSSSGWTPARPACARRSTSSAEGRGARRVLRRRARRRRPGARGAAPRRARRAARGGHPAARRRDERRFDRIAGLPLEIDDYALEPPRANVSSGFLRRRRDPRCAARGRGRPRRGRRLRRRGPRRAARAPAPSLPLAGELDARRLLRPRRGARPVPGAAAARGLAHYRLWAFESAALDLALRQAGRPLHERLGRAPRPGHLRLLAAPARAAGDRRPARAPASTPTRTLRFKLDPTPDWDAALIGAGRDGRGRHASTSRASTGHHRRQPGRPAFYRADRRAGFPERLDRGPAT